ncbi:MAG: D-ribose pyranase [Lachnospiraceae bacterium]|nr:D-ribose pyranase [Lachnospiraceae bacterium]
MRKTGLLNTELIAAISRIGHTQYMIISDAGLPVPEGVKVIDLALKSGLPSFCDTLEAVLSELVIEHYYLADEIKTKNALLDQTLTGMINKKDCDYISHEQLKEMSKTSEVIVRTGETSPYANIVLVAGVNF